MLHKKQCPTMHKETCPIMMTENKNKKHSTCATSFNCYSPLSLKLKQFDAYFQFHLSLTLSLPLSLLFSAIFRCLSSAGSSSDGYTSVYILFFKCFPPPTPLLISLRPCSVFLHIHKIIYCTFAMNFWCLPTNIQSCCSLSMSTQTLVITMKGMLKLFDRIKIFVQACVNCSFHSTSERNTHMKYTAQLVPQTFP